MTLELARALREGTTRPCMAALVLASFFQAGQFLLDTNIMAKAKLTAMSFVTSPGVWAAAYALGGAMMLWRLLDRKTRPAWAWAANTYMAALWVANYLAPAVVLRDTGALLTPMVVVPLGAAWVMMRTQATARDRAQA